MMNGGVYNIVGAMSRQRVAITVRVKYDCTTIP